MDKSSFTSQEYVKEFGEPTLSHLEEILDSKKIPTDEKLIVIRGWIRIRRELGKE